MYTTNTPIDFKIIFSYNRNIPKWIFFGKCVNSKKKKYFQKGR